MKKNNILLRLFVSCLLGLFFVNHIPLTAAKRSHSYERHIVVIVPSFNNQDWCERNVQSICQQKYDNFHVIYTNDCSDDDTKKIVEQCVKKYKQEHRFTVIHNTQRVKQLANIYKAVHMCDDRDIMVVLDGDDWFAHANVLQRINNAYANPQVWMTYGSYRTWPQGGVRSLQRVDLANLRKERFSASHLRSFYAWLFKNIDIDDLQDETGNFFPAAADVATMFPMLEMAGMRHSLLIRDVLYIYNRANVLNIVQMQQKQNITQQCPYCDTEVHVPTHKSSHIIRHHRKSYKPLTYPSIRGKAIL